MSVSYRFIVAQSLIGGVLLGVGAAVGYLLNGSSPQSGLSQMSSELPESLTEKRVVRRREILVSEARNGLGTPRPEGLPGIVRDSLVVYGNYVGAVGDIELFARGRTPGPRLYRAEILENNGRWFLRLWGTNCNRERARVVVLAQSRDGRREAIQVEFLPTMKDSSLLVDMLLRVANADSSEMGQVDHVFGVPTRRFEYAPGRSVPLPVGNPMVAAIVDRDGAVSNSIAVNVSEEVLRDAQRAGSTQPRARARGRP